MWLDKWQKRKHPPQGIAILKSFTVGFRGRPSFVDNPENATGIVVQWPCHHLLDQPVKRGDAILRLVNLPLAIAFAAYSLCLFNIQVFTCGHAFLNDMFHVTGIHLDIAMVVLVVPILFAFSFLLQRGENEVIKRIRSTRAT